MARMKSAANEDTMTRYLLGQLPEQDAATLEERFFRDDDFFEELRAVEADLIDQYVRGELSGAELHQFGSHFLKSAARRQRVDFAKALADAANQSATQAPSAMSTAGSRRVALSPMPPRPLPKWLAIAAMLLLVAGAWLAFENRRLARQIRSVQDSRFTEESHRRELEGRVKDLQSSNSQLTAELEQERRKQPSSGSSIASVVAFVLSPGMVRSTDEPTRLVVPKEVDKVKLQLDVETAGDHQSYRVELRTVGGQLVWSQDMLQARTTNWGKVVVFLIPSSVLAAGEHELTLRGLIGRGKFEDSSYYYFSVIKR